MPSLKRQSDFQTLRNQGEFLHITHWLAISFIKNKERKFRWGWTLPKKIGNAVVRNRLKRWGREFVREFGNHELDINFIFKNKNKDFYKSLEHEEFDRAFEKVFKKTKLQSS